MSDAIPFKDVHAWMAERLEDAGWKYRAVGLSLDVAPDVVGFLGLNYRNVIGEGIDVNPIIGVRHQVVERLLHRLLELPFRRHVGTTVSEPLHALMPEFTGWVFTDRRTAPAVASRLAAEVTEYGMPFIRSASTLEGILRHIDLGHGHGLEFSRPLVLALLGRTGDAQRDAEERLASLGTRTGGYPDQLRGYLTRFLETLPEIGGDAGGRP